METPYSAVMLMMQSPELILVEKKGSWLKERNARCYRGLPVNGLRYSTTVLNEMSSYLREVSEAFVQGDPGHG